MDSLVAADDKKRKSGHLDGEHAEAGRSKTRRSVQDVELDVPKEEVEAMASRMASEDLTACLCPDFGARWAELRTWAQRLCELGEVAKDELLYWETYKASPGELPRDQLLRQVREDFEDMASRLIEEGCTEEVAAVAKETTHVEALCELLAYLLNILEKGTESQRSAEGTQPPERRYFSVRLDLNQDGCSKFHDASRLTTLRLVVPLVGPGPILALSKDVDWTFCEQEAGLLESLSEAMPEDGLELLRQWNEKVCPPEKEVHTSEGSLLMLKGGEVSKKPLQRAAYSSPEEDPFYCPPVGSPPVDPAPARFLITLDHVTADVREQLIEMNLDSEAEDDEDGLCENSE